MSDADIGKKFKTRDGATVEVASIYGRGRNRTVTYWERLPTGQKQASKKVRDFLRWVERAAS